MNATISAFVRSAGFPTSNNIDVTGGHQLEKARGEASQAALDYQRIEKAICYLQEHFLEQPDLSAIARAAHLSEFHFQRLFSRWAGVSPKRFLQFLTVEHAKQRLAESKPVLEATFDS